MRTLLVMCGLATMWVACGGVTFANDGDGGGGEGGSLAGGCPSTFPADGSSCSSSGLECEYAGVAEFCTRLSSCQAGKFNHSDGVCSLPVGGSSCPSTKAQVSVGQACTTRVTCDYADGRCGCASQGGPAMVDGGGLHWICSSAQPGCPAERPFLGTGCSMEGQTCDYGGCALGNGGPYTAPLVRKCSGGIWVRSAALCPA